MTDACQPCSEDGRGRAWARVPAKQPGDPARIGVDWHDWLIRTWPGSGYTVALGTAIRFPRGPARKQSNPTGIQFRASTAGVTGPFEPKWPKTIGATVADGSVVWTAEAVSTDSLQRTVASQAWSVPTGVTSSGESVTADGFEYSVLISGGADGQEYACIHRVVFSDGQADSGVVILPVSAAAEGS